MATFNKVSFANANPRGQGDNRLKSIPAKASHLNTVITDIEAGTAGQYAYERFSNKIEVDAATLTIAYATHMSRPVVQKQACVFTLPAVAALQGEIWIINGAADGTLMTLSPHADDMFVWDVAGAGGANDKDVINTAATAKRGDYIKLRYADANGWMITEMGGTWVDES